MDDIWGYDEIDDIVQAACEDKEFLSLCKANVTEVIKSNRTWSLLLACILSRLLEGEPLVLQRW